MEVRQCLATGPAVVAAIEWENLRAEIVWKAICKQLKHGCGSMCWHTWGAPGLSAGLVHEDAEVCASSLAFFRKLDDMLKMASGGPLVQSMLEGQGMESSLMQWLRKAARESAPGPLPLIARDLLVKFWVSISTTSSSRIR